MVNWHDNLLHAPNQVIGCAKFGHTQNYGTALVRCVTNINAVHCVTIPLEYYSVKNLNSILKVRDAIVRDCVRNII